VDNALDHLRIDIVAVGDDELVAAPDESEEATVVELAKVSRVKPPAGERLPGRFRVAPILTEQVRTAHMDPADLPGDDWLSAVVDHLQLDPLQRDSDRAGRPQPVEWKTGNDERFGHPVAVDQRPAEDLLKER